MIDSFGSMTADYGKMGVGNRLDKNSLSAIADALTNLAKVRCGNDSSKDDVADLDEAIYALHRIQDRHRSWKNKK